MEKVKGEFFDLTNALVYDTYLVVKFASGKMVHYNVPMFNNKKNCFRTFGDLYTYFTNREGFRFAIGYMRDEDETGLYWTANIQYFYFDKKTAPQMCVTVLKTPLLLNKQRLQTTNYKPQNV